jgi:pimeloyl-ACP methyl ester carboxylesterase
MIGTLRQQLADQGYTTLSIQMPILAVNAKGEDYPPTFPEAAERLQLAVDYLHKKGLNKVAIVSHSMGSRMSHFYMAKNPPGVSAWAALGLASADTYKGIQVPILDLYGAKDLPLVLSGAKKRLASLKRNPASKQVVIADTDHFFANHEEEMVKAVKAFLDSVQ